MKKLVTIAILITLLMMMVSSVWVASAQEPTSEPTEELTVEPTEEPTAEPTVEPTVEPTEEPTAEPTVEPTVEPTEEPTVEPTEEPTAEPTEEPTVEPTAEPTEEPTVEPTEEPTAEPTEEPTAEPTEEPTDTPVPTVEPTVAATPIPTPVVDAAGGIGDQASPNRTTTIAIQNATSSTNEVSLSYYNVQGTPVASVNNSSFTLGAYASRRIPASTDISAGNFQGAAVIGASGNAAAAVFMLDTANGNTVDMYDGIGSSGADTTLNFPMVHRQPGTYHWYSTLVIQNTDTSQTANVTISFRTMATSTVVYSTTATIPAQSSKYFNLQDSAYATINTRSGNQNWYGSAQVVSTNGLKLAGKLIQTNSDTGVTGVHTAFLSTDGATTYYVPTVHAQINTWGWNGWIMVMNPNSTSASVRCQYIYKDGTTTHTTTASIPGNSSYLFYGSSYPQLPAKDSSWYGSAVLTSQNGVTFFAEYGATNLKSPSNLLYLTKGSKSGGTATTLFYPYFEGRAPGYNSWLTVQNVGTGPANLTVQYYNLNGTTARAAINYTGVPVGASKVHSAELDGFKVSWSGSVVVTSNNGQSIAGFGSIFENSRMSSGYDTCGAYNAVGY